MDLDVAGVCRIIEACSQAGVSRLKFLDLEVELGGKAIPPEPVIPDEPEAREAVEAKAMAQTEIAVKEEQTANLLLEDPSQFEELLAVGELTSAES